MKGYSVCPNDWILDKSIKNELGLLLIISSLCGKKNLCWASNDYLAELFNESPVSISRKLKLLENKKYIKIDYEKIGCRVSKRIITINKNVNRTVNNSVNGGKQFCASTINKNVKENIINNNNIYYLFINKIKDKKIELEKTCSKFGAVVLANKWAKEQPEYLQLTEEERMKIILEV